MHYSPKRIFPLRQAPHNFASTTHPQPTQFPKKISISNPHHPPKLSTNLPLKFAKTLNPSPTKEPANDPQPGTRRVYLLIKTFDVALSTRIPPARRD